MFKEGRELVEDKLHFERPTPLVLESDRTFALISGETGLSVATVHTIVKDDLAIRKVCTKLVPGVLSEE